MSEDGCRIDVWLWRARFFKSRTLASEVVDTGRLRLVRDGRESRPDKPSRLVKPGDLITFAFAGKLRTVRIEALGTRRGPPQEALRLYANVDED